MSNMVKEERKYNLDPSNTNFRVFIQAQPGVSIQFKPLQAKDPRIQLTCPSSPWGGSHSIIFPLKDGGVGLHPAGLQTLCLPASRSKKEPRISKREINFFNWRIIALQCCVGFCHAAAQISPNYTHIHIPPSSWGLPSGRGGKESACQCKRSRRCELDPWVGKIR